MLEEVPVSRTPRLMGSLNLCLSASDTVSLCREMFLVAGQYNLNLGRNARGFFLHQTQLWVLSIKKLELDKEILADQDTAESADSKPGKKTYKVI